MRIAMESEATYLQVEILDQQAQLLEELGRDGELLGVSDRAIFYGS